MNKTFKYVGLYVYPAAVCGDFLDTTGSFKKYENPHTTFQFNFVGRILGPRGLTAKQLEQETGCKVMVRGRGSMRDKKKVRFLRPVLIRVPSLSV